LCRDLLLSLLELLVVRSIFIFRYFSLSNFEIICLFDENVHC